MTETDLSHVAFGLAIGVDMIAVSFVKTPEDVLRVKRFVAERGMTTPVIAKIEKHEALACIDEIVAVADGIMVARGDLGIEIPLERVPLVQKDLIARANRASKPVVTATQMLQSMITSATPTRAEATDVANAIIDGTDAVMLSGETAMGAYPVEAVATMARIAREVEGAYPHADLAERRIKGIALTTETSIAEAAAHLSEVLGLGLIITGTAGGNTARHVSSFRPHARIAAMTSNDAVARRSAILWGVEPYVVTTYSTFEELIDIAQQRALAEGLASPGDTVAITSGMPVGAGRHERPQAAPPSGAGSRASRSSYAPACSRATPSAEPDNMRAISAVTSSPSSVSASMRVPPRTSRLRSTTCVSAHEAICAK